MTLPHHDDYYVVLDDDWNAHVDAINANTTKNADQDAWIATHLDGVTQAGASHATINTRLDTVEGDVSTLDGRVDTTESDIASHGTQLADHESRITTLENDGGGGGSVTPWPDDTALYGDVISNVPRRDAWYGETLGNGYMSVSATVATKSIAAPTTGKFGVLTPAAGSGTFRWAMYTGPSLSSLSMVDEGGWTAALTSAGVQDGLSLNGFSITAGQFVALLWLCSGYSTEANLASTPFGAGTQNIIADGTSVYSVWDQNNPSSLPSTLDLTDSGTGGTWTQASNQFWFAIR